MTTNDTVSVELFPGAVYDVGCYLEGSRGWRNTGHLVELAANVSATAGDDGFTLTAADQRLVNAFFNGEGGYVDDRGNSMNVDDEIEALAYNALDYLNGLARAAAERGQPECFWNWENGELMFSVVEEAEDA